MGFLIRMHKKIKKYTMIISSFCSFLRAKVVVSIVTLMGGVILSSCSQDESSLLPEDSNIKRPVQFDVNLKKGWKNDKEGRSRLSRGVAVDEFDASFGMFSGVYANDTVDKMIMNYMYNEECGESADGWQTVSSYIMPSVALEMSCYAYYPYQDPTEELQFLTFNGGDSLHRGAPFFDFVIPTNLTDQVDLMVAQTPFTTDRLIAKEHIPLHFYHMLTAVRFTIDESVPVGYIRKISIEGVTSGGRYTFDGSLDWVPNNVLAEYVLERNIRTGTGSKVYLEDDEVFLMMPQFLSDQSKVKIVFDDGQALTLTSQLDGKEWQAGKIVTYNIKISSLHSLTLEATIEPWEDGETFNWTSGY